MNDRTIAFFEGELREIAAKSARAQKRRYFPSAKEIVLGCAAFGGDIWEDIIKWHGLLTSRGQRHETCRSLALLLAPAILTKSPVDLEGIYDRANLTIDFGSQDELLRLALYETMLFPEPSASASAMLEYACKSGPAKAWRDGLSYFGRMGLDAEMQARRLRHGIELASFSSRQDIFLAEAQRRLASSGTLGRRLLDEQLVTFADELHRSVHDDSFGRADAQETLPEKMESSASAPSGFVVLSRPTGKMTADSKRIWDTFDGVSDKPLLPVLAPDRPIADGIAERWPHARDLVETLLGDLVLGEPIHLRPSLIVGGPGSGKTSLLLAVAKVLEVPAVVYSCTSSSDNSFGGTASRWSSAGPSVPLETIRQHHRPNPLVIIDEIEKAAHSDRYGGVVDTLLPLLEPHTACRYFEAGLGAKANLSHVTYLATANTLHLSAPLQDRFRILRMPDPQPCHLPALCRFIIEDIARELRQVGMIGQLTPDEMELVGKNWVGGSLRRLRRIVSTVVTVRDRLETRQ